MAVPLTSAMQTSIANLYISILGRNPDPVGFGYWCDVYANANGTKAALDAIASGFGKSPEFTGIYSGQTVANAVALMYNNILGRTQDAAGATYWQGVASNYITSGKTIGDAYALTANAMITAAAANTGTADATLIASKQAAAVSAGTATPTTPYTLTTAVGETINATGANNVINGSLGFAADESAIASLTTFDVSDTLNGNSNGRNTFNLTVSGAADGAIATPAALLSNIQTVNVRQITTSGTLTVNTATFTGTTAVNSDRSTSTVTITNLATGASAGQIGNGTITNGALNFGYATASAAATLNVSGGTLGAGAIGVTSATTALTINSTGAANVIGAVTITDGGTNRVTAVNINAATNLTLASLSDDFATGGTVTVTGAATNVTLGTAPATLEVINASGLTAGGITMTIGNLASVITGGAGVDTITTGGTQTGAVSGGDGTADILVVATATDIAATPAAKFTNFEILRNATDNNLDVSTVSGITSIQLSGGGGAISMNATQAAAVRTLSDQDTLTLALTTATGTSDVLTATLQNTTATASADLTTATVDGFETINIISSSGSFADINSFTTASAANLKNLNFSGAAPVSTAATSSVAVAINASALTAVGSSATQYTFTQSGTLVKASSVVGSAAADSLTTQLAGVTGTTGEFVTYDAGAGNDLITSVVAAINNTSAGNASVKIDGGIGTDTLSLAAGTAMVDNNFQYITNIEKLTFTGNNKIDVTTGGFFDANFKAAGVEITAGNLGLAGGTTAVANVLNASTFTGNVKATLTQSATGTADVGDSFTVTTHSGNDSITLTVTETLTNGSQVVINTGSGNDTVALTIPALAAGTVTVNLGSGNDTFTAGTAASIVTGGTGADNMTGAGGVDTFVQTMGASVAATGNTLATTIANGNTITFGNGLDTIRAFTSGTDKVNTDIDSSAGGAAAIVNGVGQLASAVQTSNFYFRGDYLNGAFTISATGADTLVSLGKAASTLTFADATGYVLFVGINTVANADFI